MKKLSDKDLYALTLIFRDRQNLNSDEGDYYCRKYEKYKNELLSRLSNGQQAIKAMEKLITYLPILKNHPLTWKEQAELTYIIETAKQQTSPLCTYDCDKCGKTYQDVLYPNNPQHCCYCFECRNTIANQEKEPK